MVPHHDSASYRSVDITGQLPGRGATHRDETAILLALARSIAEQPDASLQLLVECAMGATSAHSTGISVADVDAEGQAVFRWVATAGAFGPYLHATLPRFFSPCGDAVRIDRLLLMREPALHYPYIADLDIPVKEVLLSPIHRHGKAVGTVWAALHDDSRHFNAEDGRLLSCLTQFVGETADLLDRLSFGLTL